MATDISLEEIRFFEAKRDAFPLYEALRAAIFTTCGPVDIQVKKTQISFINRHLFGAVSFTPVRKAKERPNPYITVTFGLLHQVGSPRIDAAVEAYPHRFTHHLIIGSTDEIDDELLHWLKEAADFAAAKR